MNFTISLCLGIVHPLSPTSDRKTKIKINSDILIIIYYIYT